MERFVNDSADKRNSVCNKRRQKKGRIVLLLFAILFLAGCFQHYYKTNTMNRTETAFIEKLKAANKYFIIHYGDNIMGTRGLEIKDGALEAQLAPLPKEHSYYTQPEKAEENVMKVKHEANTLMEVHVYTNATPGPVQDLLVMPFAGITRIDVYELDEKATNRNRTWSVVGIAASAAAIAGAAVLISSAVDIGPVWNF